MHGERHRSYTDPFMNEERAENARAFARSIMEQL
jgi:hypothetical protein